MWCVPIHAFLKLPYDFQYGPCEVTSDIHKDTDDVCVKTGMYLSKGVTYAKAVGILIILTL